MKFHFNTKIFAILAVVGAPVLAQDLPPPQSHDDPKPPVPRVDSPGNTGVTAQAGVGGTQAYAREGVLELGGRAGFTSATEHFNFDFAPTVGWFFMDNWQISGITKWNYIKEGGGDGSHTVTFLAEPSFHMPFSETFFGFAGVGAGLSHQTGGAGGVGFAVAPRLGVKCLVGRSGMLTTDLQVAFSTNDLVHTSGQTALTVKNVVGMGVGYTVLW